MQLQKTATFDRKSDARKKIMLGGLLVKAGLDYLHPDNAHILYGMLLDCKEQLIIQNLRYVISNITKKLG